MKNDFAAQRKLIVPAQSQLPLHPKHQRQRAGNQQAIVKLTAQKRRVNPWFHEPAVDCIKSAGGEKKRIAPVAEPFHKRAIIKKPAATAIKSLSNNIMVIRYTTRLL